MNIILRFVKPCIVPHWITSMKTFDFTKFIQEHEEAIFGKVNNIKGQPNVFAYRKQIAALHIKMNEFINKNQEKGIDQKFLLGLFAYAITQFGVSVKTDVDRYKDDFYAFLKEGGM